MGFRKFLIVGLGILIVLVLINMLILSGREQPNENISPLGRYDYGVDFDFERDVEQSKVNDNVYFVGNNIIEIKSDGTLRYLVQDYRPDEADLQEIAEVFSIDINNIEIIDNEFFDDPALESGDPGSFHFGDYEDPLGPYTEDFSHSHD